MTSKVCHRENNLLRNALYKQGLNFNQDNGKKT